MRAAYVLLALAACSQHEQAKPAPAAAPAKPKLAHASQTDLAKELDDADRMGAWSDVRRRWQGQEIEWTVTRHRLMCSSERVCHVAAFPVQRPAQRGWMPGLELAPGEWAKLEAGCGKAESCELVITGTLAKLDASAELPTSVTITNVHVRRMIAG